MPLISASEAKEKSNEALVIIQQRKLTQTRCFIEDKVVPLINQNIELGHTRCNIETPMVDFDITLFKDMLHNKGYRVTWTTVRNVNDIDIGIYNRLGQYNYKIEISWA